MNTNITDSKKIILAGGSGFLGKTLTEYFLKAGWSIIILTRLPRQSGGMARQVAWDARTLGAWQKDLEGANVIVNFTGKSVDCRYTPGTRQEILESRVNSTRVLGEAIGLCHQPPQVWLNASTATIYKHTFDLPWDENGETGSTPEAKDAFSVEVAEAWERTFNQAKTPGTRKIAMRMAMVLGMGKNSVFPVLRRLVHLGLGGKMGDGRQFVSWMHEVDYCRAVEWLITHDAIHGPINLAAPNPIPNYEMMKTLRRICRVPIGLPATNWMLEVGAFFLGTETELVIKSRRVVPRRLIDTGFSFKFHTIYEAFANLCSRLYQTIP